jgi:hypothetical protein
MIPNCRRGKGHSFQQEHEWEFIKILDILTPCIWYATQLMQYRMLMLLTSLQAYFVNSLKTVLSEPKKNLKYRVIHKTLRDFRPQRYSNRDGHVEGEHVNRKRDTPSFCPTLQVLDMSTLGGAADVIWQLWQIPRYKTISYSLSTPLFVTTAP